MATKLEFKQKLNRKYEDQGGYDGWGLILSRHDGLPAAHLEAVLAAQYHVSTTTIRRWLKEDGWRE